jgi:Redoxin
MKGNQSDVRFVLFLLASSLAVNAFLGYRMLRPDRGAGSGIAVGQLLPPAEVRTLDGQRELIRYSEQRRPTVLYVFSPTCHFCAANLENVKYLARAKGADFRFIGVSIQPDGLASYARAHDINFSVYTATAAMQSAYSLTVVPQTLLIESSGRVIRSWTGAYVGDVKREVEESFRMEFPKTPTASS